jgi:hypothetical protein
MRCSNGPENAAQLASGLHPPGSAMELLLYLKALEGEADKRAIMAKGRASEERSEAQKGARRRVSRQPGPRGCR